MIESHLVNYRDRFPDKITNGDINSTEQADAVLAQVRSGERGHLSASELKQIHSAKAPEFFEFTLLIDADGLKSYAGNENFTYGEAYNIDGTVSKGIFAAYRRKDDF